MKEKEAKRKKEGKVRYCSFYLVKLYFYHVTQSTLNRKKLFSGANFYNSGNGPPHSKNNAYCFHQTNSFNVLQRVFMNINIDLCKDNFS